MKIRLVDPIYLVPKAIEPSKSPIDVVQNTQNIQKDFQNTQNTQNTQKNPSNVSGFFGFFGSLGFFWVFGAIFVLAGLYWCFKDLPVSDNPDLRCLPETLKNNEFFSKFKSEIVEVPDTIKENDVKSYNDDDVAIKYNTIHYNEIQ